MTITVCAILMLGIFYKFLTFIEDFEQIVTKHLQRIDSHLELIQQKKRRKQNDKDSSS